MASGKLPKGALPGAVTRLIAALSALGSAGQVLRVNAAGTGIEFADGWTETATGIWNSGTSFDWTSIPSGVNEILVLGKNVSLDSNSMPLIQLGDSGGVESTGYSNGSGDYVPTANHQASTNGAGLALTASTSSLGGGSWVFAARLNRMIAASNTWMMAAQLSRVDVALTAMSIAVKSLSAELDRVRLTTSGGTAVGDAAGSELKLLYRRG